MSTRKEEWRDIPGFDGWYQISDWGHIRSFRCQSGKRLELPAQMNPRLYRGAMTVWLRNADGTYRRFEVARLMADVWMGGAPVGSVFKPKDGNPQNVCRWNIKIMTRSEFAKQNASKRKFPVLKIDTSLQIVDAYRSAAQAEKANHYAKKVLADYCNLKRTSVIAGDGYIYAWDDEKWMRKTMSRAMRELDAKGIRYNDPFTECYYDLPPEVELQVDPGLPWETAPAICGGGLHIRSL